ncbi:MAG: S-adenosylmethionine:tRNA ribosyltransferase-isomerase [Prevotellaceae bacterium]|jgi:S-adenosylmethionine:tRNA ribosyltransferase-isomerase|nr:S-adenosylmethionine:tRNA ribosyltransferase-isomerase [Prevotellaceae bacterium]
MNPCVRPEIRISEYDYALPEACIARFPLARRDEARLLTFSGDEIGETVFSALPDLIPPSSLMVFNETKVIPARLLFRRDTGAAIELFCLDPYRPADYEQCFAAGESCVWRCIAGHSKRWKGDILKRSFGAHTLQAECVEKRAGDVLVRFSWDGGAPFAQVLEQCGTTPIPPYLRRDAVPDDRERYQTVYARHRGSVAAPTAGLHFTPATLDAIARKGIKTETLTLHVGAGTFRPVKTATIAEHIMHEEPFTVSRTALQSLLEHMGRTVAVGTTSARTLESLYFLGQQCLRHRTPQRVGQWEAADTVCDASPAEALAALADYMDTHRLERLDAATQLLIAPPYRFKVVGSLLTNFHQPQSTLLLLVAALVGERWREAYRYAVEHQFRFLSYGDCSLLHAGRLR